MRSFKKLRLAGVALATASTMFLLNQGTAFAAQPGEEGEWHHEYLPNGSYLEVQNTLQEARQTNGDLAQAWRANDPSGNLWFMVRQATTTGPIHPVNQPVPAIGSPSITPWAGYSFRIAFTGTDHHIYISSAFQATNSASTLANITFRDSGFTSSAGPHIAQLGAGQASAGLSFVSNDSSQRILYSTFTTVSQPNFTGFADLGGQTTSTPVVVYLPVTDRIYVAHVGVDGQTYVNSRLRSIASSWGAWVNLHGSAVGAPAAAATPSGDLVLAVRAPDTTTWYERVNPSLQVVNGWSVDIAHYRSQWDPGLSVNDNGDVYGLLTGEDNNNTYYKKVENG